MARDMAIRWQEPQKLGSGAKQNLIFALADLEDLPEHPGVYVFGRIQSRSHFIPVYIGKAENLRRRIKSQLNNARLMIGLRNEPGRGRLLAIGEYDGRPGPRANRAIQVAERVLIEHALAMGHTLLNHQGTRRPHHSISFSGSRKAREWLPPVLSAPAAR